MQKKYSGHRFDKGTVKALWLGGWNPLEIAEEMNMDGAGEYIANVIRENGWHNLKRRKRQRATYEDIHYRYRQSITKL